MSPFHYGSNRANVYDRGDFRLYIIFARQPHKTLPSATNAACQLFGEPVNLIGSNKRNEDMAKPDGMVSRCTSLDVSMLIADTAEIDITTRFIGRHGCLPQFPPWWAMRLVCSESAIHMAELPHAPCSVSAFGPSTVNVLKAGKNANGANAPFARLYRSLNWLDLLCFPSS